MSAMLCPDRITGRVPKTLEVGTVAQMLEQLASTGRAGFFLAFPDSIAYQLTQHLAVGVRVGLEKGFDVCVTAIDQALSPLLESLKGVITLSLFVFNGIKAGIDGIQVFLTHQLANVLHVPPPPFVRPDSGRFVDGRKQVVR